MLQSPKRSIIKSPTWKRTSLKQKLGVYNRWSTYVDELGLLDKRYHNDKYLMREDFVNEMFLDTFKAIVRNKPQSNCDQQVFVETLVDLIQRRYSNAKNPQQEMRKCLNSILYSFKQLAVESSDLAFYTHILDPQASRSASSLAFFLKALQYINNSFGQKQERGNLSNIMWSCEQWLSFVDNVLGPQFVERVSQLLKSSDRDSFSSDNHKVDMVTLLLVCLNVYEKEIRVTTQPDRPILQFEVASTRTQASETVPPPRQSPSPRLRLAFDYILPRDSKVTSPSQRQPKSSERLYSSGNRLKSSINEEKFALQEISQTKRSHLIEAVVAQELLARQYKKLALLTKQLMDRSLTMVSDIRKQRNCSSVQLAELEYLITESKKLNINPMEQLIIIRERCREF